MNDADTVSNVTFEFSETVTGFTESDVTVVGGVLSAFTAVDGDSFTATFTATDGVETTGSVTVGTGYTDTAGNTGTGGSDTVTIDTLNPSVTVNIAVRSVPSRGRRAADTTDNGVAPTGPSGENLGACGLL